MNEGADLARAEADFRRYLDGLADLGAQLVNEVQPISNSGPAPERFVGCLLAARGIRLAQGIGRLGVDFAYEAHPPLRVLFELWANLEWIFTTSDPAHYARRFIEYAYIEEIRRLERVPRRQLPPGAAENLEFLRACRKTRCPSLMTEDGSVEHWAGNRKSMENRLRDIASLPSLKGTFFEVGSEKGAPTIL